MMQCSEIIVFSTDCLQSHIFFASTTAELSFVLYYIQHTWAPDFIKGGRGGGGGKRGKFVFYCIFYWKFLMYDIQSEKGHTGQKGQKCQVSMWDWRQSVLKTSLATSCGELFSTFVWFANSHITSSPPIGCSMGIECRILLIHNCWTEMLARSLCHIIILVHFRSKR
jgi:hypothetical protein